jgi:hypothetical protein
VSHSSFIRNYRQRATAKRKATLDAAGEPASRRPAPKPFFHNDAPTDASAPSIERGPTPATGGLAYAAVFAGRAIPHQSSGPLKPTAKRLANADPALSQEAALRRKSSDLSGPLSGMPAGTTSIQTPVVYVVPAGEQRNKTPIFIRSQRHAWLPGLAAGYMS